MTTRTAHDPSAVDATEMRLAEDLDACLSAQRSGAPPNSLIEAFGAEASTVAALTRRMGWMPGQAYVQPKPLFEKKLRARVATEFVSSISQEPKPAFLRARRHKLLVVGAAVVLVLGFFAAGVPGRVRGPAATAQAQTGTATLRTPVTHGTTMPSSGPTPMAQKRRGASAMHAPIRVGASQPEPARTPIAHGTGRPAAAPTRAPIRTDTVGALPASPRRCSPRAVEDHAVA